MNYSLFILKGVIKELGNLQKKDYIKIKRKIKKLIENPRPTGCKKLKGREGWRIREGNYRIIYEINDKDKKVVVLHVGLRKDIYRK